MNNFKKNISNKNPFAVPGHKERRLRLPGNKKGDWLEESIFDQAIKTENERPGYISTAVDGGRTKGFFVFFLVLLSLLFARTAFLQIFKGDYYRAVAEGNRIRVQTVRADRGIIYDKNLTPLVENTPSFFLSIIPGDLPKDGNKRDLAIKKIADIAGQDVGEINEILKSYSPYYYQDVPIKDNVTYEEAILAEITGADLPGLVSEISAKRNYLNKTKTGVMSSLYHVLGYVGRVNQADLAKDKSDYTPSDFVGKAGLELYWENMLRGRNGKRQIEVDALGKEKRVIAEEIPVPGKNLVLSLDIGLQQKSEEILRDYLRRFGKKKGVVIIENPNNGEILSIVSLPAVDSNLFITGFTKDEYDKLINKNPDRPLYNRAISGEYPSGSTIKPMISAAALQERIITERTTFFSTGGIMYDKWFFPDWAAGGHGLTNVTRAIAESINTFFYIIGGGYKDFIGLGMTKLVEYTHLFGLGRELGIDLPNESSGLIPTPEWKEKTKNEQWYIGDTYHFAIGQGDVLVTPLQMVTATAFFANQGTIYRPHLVKEIISPDTNEKTEIQPEIAKANFISPANIDIVRRGMRQTVTAGSGRMLGAVPVAVAGKTGTAQWGTGKTPHAWFTGFAPYNNPEVAITVLVEEGGEGSVISTQITKDILSWYFSRK